MAKRALADRIGLSALVFALWIAGPAAAQENLDAGKTAAQLFKSDCAICHKSPNGLAGSTAWGVQNFLRLHYTASPETAALLAGYLQAVAKQPAPAHRATKRRSTKPVRGEKPKLPPPKPSVAKPSAAKPSGDKAEQAKAASSAAKPAEKKSAEPKPAAPKAADTAEKPPADATPETKSENKPEKKPE